MAPPGPLGPGESDEVAGSVVEAVVLIVFMTAMVIR
jgi:hypothetical protein